MYYNKSDTKKEVSKCPLTNMEHGMTKNLNIHSSTFIKTAANRRLLFAEYGVSVNALSRWIKQYSVVEVDNGEVLTALQVKELQKRNAHSDK